MITIATLREILASCPLPDDTAVAIQNGEDSATSLTTLSGVRTTGGDVILVLMSEGESIHESALTKSKLN